jgi:hypothetical protein
MSEKHNKSEYSNIDWRSEILFIPILYEHLKSRKTVYLRAATIFNKVNNQFFYVRYV